MYTLVFGYIYFAGVFSFAKRRSVWERGRAVEEARRSLASRRR